jgi:hypothetical protein
MYHAGVLAKSCGCSEFVKVVLVFLKKLGVSGENGRVGMVSA